MNYTVYTLFINGAKGNVRTCGTKDKAYAHLVSTLADPDIGLVAREVVIASPRCKIYSHPASEIPLKSAPPFNEIQWPRRGRDASLKEGAVISSIVEKDDIAYLKKRGEGVISKGVRKVIDDSKKLHGLKIAEAGSAG